MTPDLSILLDRLLPESLEPFLRPLLGTMLPPDRKSGRYKIAACGRFRGALTPELLDFIRTQKRTGALIVAEPDVTRVLFYRGGTVIGALSDVVFERLGRILLRGEVLHAEDARSLVDCEERRGLAVAVSRVSKDAAEWGIEQRIWEIAAALYFMGRCHYVLVDGEPHLAGIPTPAVETTQLAMEGMRRYDEWRNGSGDGSGGGSGDGQEAAPDASTEKAPPLEDAPRPTLENLDRVAPTQDAAAEAADIMRKLRGFKT